MTDELKKRIKTPFGDPDQRFAITLTRAEILEIISGLQRFRQNCSLPMDRSLPPVPTDPNYSFGNEGHCPYCREDRGLQLRLREVIS